MLAALRAWTAQNLGPVSSTLASSRLERALFWLIVANLVVFVLETVPGLFDAYARELAVFEALSLAVFALEYLGRLWVCVDDERYRSPFFGRLRWVFSPLALLDLVVLVPAALPMLGLDLRLARTFRLFRLMRGLKLVRYSKSVRTLVAVLVSKRAELLVTLSFALTLLLFASSAMYFIERETQPEAFSSIPAAMWWAVTTLTTVGYGDVYPQTVLGRWVAAVIAVVGVGLFAPTRAGAHTAASGSDPGRSGQPPLCRARRGSPRVGVRVPAMCATMGSACASLCWPRSPRPVPRSRRMPTRSSSDRPTTSCSISRRSSSSKRPRAGRSIAMSTRR